MKTRLFFLCCLLWIGISVANATGQQSEKLRMDNQDWDMLELPIELDSALSGNLYKSFPENRDISTAWWRGYTGCWEIVGNKLYLRKVTIEIDGKEQELSIDSIFAKYGSEKGIVASWYTGEIRAGQGKVIYYIHDGFQRHYENECIISVEHGKVVHRRFYENELKPGMTFDQALQMAKDSIRWTDFPELREKRFVLILSHSRINLDGSFKSAYIRIGLTDEKKEINTTLYPVIWELIDFFKRIPKWEFCVIDGKSKVEKWGGAIKINTQTEKSVGP